MVQYITHREAVQGAPSGPFARPSTRTKGRGPSSMTLSSLIETPTFAAICGRDRRARPQNKHGADGRFDERPAHIALLESGNGRDARPRAESYVPVLNIE